MTLDYNLLTWETVTEDIQRTIGKTRKDVPFTSIVCKEEDNEYFAEILYKMDLLPEGTTIWQFGPNDAIHISHCVKASDSIMKWNPKWFMVSR